MQGVRARQNRHANRIWRILDRALGAVQIRREDVYVTNAVKHFRYIQRGKRRLHQRPLIRQEIACKPWLQAELKAIRPKLTVCLGTNAAHALLGNNVRIASERGHFIETEAGVTVFVTIHPSAVFRQRDRCQQENGYRAFLADIKLVQDWFSEDPDPDAA